ncbi:hypothetical protein BZA77DRAFT_301201 [Pyronema omphalodes]|nr:hypothetical protein BZA77DRAFT_301201 [Pyronema omphalodes]
MFCYLYLYLSIYTYTYAVNKPCIYSAIRYLYMYIIAGGIQEMSLCYHKYSRWRMFFFYRGGGVSLLFWYFGILVFLICGGFV